MHRQDPPVVQAQVEQWGVSATEGWQYLQTGQDESPQCLRQSLWKRWLHTVVTMPELSSSRRSKQTGQLGSSTAGAVATPGGAGGRAAAPGVATPGVAALGGP
ncbi:hypothetical protein F751_1770 [Auxenochlorella protothecoides]|uniref:Uncharacterized protein n=1 Tax=Auxenochlorella protothecoides TaxID=3075 RepID=A0A087SGN7_AUXPR|nr:hypothetical protein F751_1770 [Auxenochlorella protothecoides]KFM24891.1 hypothetical protein F751_1770 [Auxenochlorella protothecoides]